MFICFRMFINYSLILNSVNILSNMEVNIETIWHIRNVKRQNEVTLHWKILEIIK